MSSTQTIRIRVAEASDAADIADVHDASWMEAYRGIIPGKHLERMVQRRGEGWWRHAIRRGSRIAVLDVGKQIAGYATYGKNRVGSLPYRGEIFEIYLLPEYQGLGFGKRLFNAARRELANSGHTSFLVWSLADNERAVAFYEHLGGLLVGRANESFDNVQRERIAFGWH
jgi:ribosomal protein S18 acetylase RimI-like enzyme